MWFTSSCGRVELQMTMTMTQARIGSHSGPCDADIRYLSQLPTIARQLRKINPEDLRKELKGYGAWDDKELSDHAQNLQRILWIACGDITERK
jgi:hypothetical protein